MKFTLATNKLSAARSRTQAARVRSNTVSVRAMSEREAALKEMESMRSGLSAHLANTEVALKSSTSSLSSSELDTAKEENVVVLDQNNYWDYIKSAPAGQVVVVDHYTVNCGPCKMVYPKVVDMAMRYKGTAMFGKFLCSKDNRELGVSLGIKVAPTFILYKDGAKVAEMTGAKADKLEELLKSNM